MYRLIPKTPTIKGFNSPTPYNSIRSSHLNGSFRFAKTNIQTKNTLHSVNFFVRNLCTQKQPPTNVADTVTKSSSKPSFWKSKLSFKTSNTPATDKSDESKPGGNSHLRSHHLLQMITNQKLIGRESS